MIRPILAHPDPRLREPSLPVQTFDDTLRRLVDDMFDTMHHAEGIGLAAVQIGVHLRVAVMEVEDNPQRVMINPTFEPLGETLNMVEGCLSVPGVQDRTKTRIDHLRVQALGLDGEPYTFEARGLEAACVQHECDHMDGKLYIDCLSHVRRQRVLQRYNRIRRQEEGRQGE